MRLINFNETLLNQFFHGKLGHENILQEFDTVDNLNKVKKAISDFINNCNVHELIDQPFFEVHPYLIGDEKYDRATIIVGTFPSPNYLFHSINQKVKRLMLNLKHPPKINYYYGNTLNCYKLFGFTEFDTLGAIKKELEERNTQLTDIVRGCQRKSIKKKDGPIASSDDKNLTNILPNYHLLSSLLEREDSGVLVFTSGSWGIFSNNSSSNINRVGKFKDNNNSAFALFLISIQHQGYIIEFSEYHSNIWYSLNLNSSLAVLKTASKNIQNIFCKPGLLVFKIRFTSEQSQSKSYTIILLPSPSTRSNQGVARTRTFLRWVKLNNIDAFTFLKQKQKLTRLHQEERIKRELNVMLNFPENYDLYKQYKSDLYSWAISKDSEQFENLLTLQQTVV